MKNQNRMICWLGAVLLSVSSAWASKELPKEQDKIQAPYFVVFDATKDPEAISSEFLPLKSTDVEAAIAGTIANVEIRQVFQNRGDSTLTAKYVFPGSTRSAVHGLTMKVGDRVIEAEIEEKQKAKAKFEQAVAENKTASLLEQKRPNVFVMNVGHILPGDMIEVTLKYTELLVPEDLTYEFMFPTVVGPRFANGESSGAGENWVSNPFLSEGKSNPSNFNLNVSLDSGMPLKHVVCDTHETKIDYQSESSAAVALQNAGGENANRDFILRYRLADKKVASGILLHRDKKLKENFFLLTIEPPARVKPEIIPAREYVFVVDVSGSMNGFPLNTSKELMRNLIGGLNARDKFNILLFAGGSKLLSDRSLEANSRNLKQALNWLDSAQGGGGTQLTKALSKAFALSSDNSVSRSLVVITDGYVNFEAKTFDLIRDNLGEANVFAFGIGSSVNRHLIEGMAHVGGGEPFIVTEPRFAEREAERLREYISAPVLTDISVDFGDLQVYDVEPKSIPDALANRPITIFGKWKGQPKGEVTVKGVNGQGQVRLPVTIADDVETKNPALPYLWARSRIKTLSDYRSLSENRRYHDTPVVADQRDLKSEITNLGLTYSLMTEFTSFVAVDTVARENQKSSKKEFVKQPLPLPKGVANKAIGGGAATPEPGSAMMLLLAIGLVCWWYFFRRPRRALV